MLAGIVLAASVWAHMAFSAGKPYQLERTMVALVSVESSGCRDLLGDDNKSFGCSQVSEKAARAVGYKGSIKKLISNAKLNMDIGAKYLNYCIGAMGSWERGIVCYNNGPVIAANLPWYKKSCPPGDTPHALCDIVHDNYLAKVRSRLPPVIAPPVSTAEISHADSIWDDEDRQSLAACPLRLHSHIWQVVEGLDQTTSSSHTDAPQYRAVLVAQAPLTAETLRKCTL